MSTPERVKRALGKYNIIDEKVNSKVRKAAAGAAIALSSVYVDIEVRPVEKRRRNESSLTQTYTLR